jgi:hypothetical protein
MACCLALALVIGALRTAWFRVVRGTEPPRAGFAPPARRPAPGLTPTPVAVAPRPAPVAPGPVAVAPRPVGDARRPRAAVDLLLGALLGAGAYAALLTALTVTGAVVATDHPLRVTALIAAAAGAAAVRARRSPASRAGRARELAAAGAAWSLLSVLDMHVTGLVPEHLVNPLADIALHGPGFLALTAGGAALLAGPRYLSTLSPGGTR